MFFHQTTARFTCVTPQVGLSSSETSQSTWPSMRMLTIHLTRTTCLLNSSTVALQRPPGRLASESILVTGRPESRVCDAEAAAVAASSVPAKCSANTGPGALDPKAGSAAARSVDSTKCKARFTKAETLTSSQVTTSTRTCKMTSSSRSMSQCCPCPETTTKRSSLPSSAPCPIASTATTV